MFVKVPSKEVLNRKSYAQNNFLPTDEHYCRQLIGTKELFWDTFIIYYSSSRSTDSLGIITSTEELENILGRVAPGNLFLATARQLEGISTPMRISDFIKSRERHRSVVSERTMLPVKRLAIKFQESGEYPFGESHRLGLAIIAQ